MQTSKWMKIVYLKIIYYTIMSYYTIIYYALLYNFVNTFPPKITNGEAKGIAQWFSVCISLGVPCLLDSSRPVLPWAEAEMEWITGSWNTQWNGEAGRGVGQAATRK